MPSKYTLIICLNVVGTELAKARKPHKKLTTNFSRPIPLPQEVDFFSGTVENICLFISRSVGRSYRSAVRSAGRMVGLEKRTNL